MLLAAIPVAAGTPNVKVAIQFQAVSTGHSQRVDATGRAVITERGVARGRGRVSVQDTATRARQTTSIFTIVEDGGAGRILVAAEIPHPEIAFVLEYATGRGYLVSGIQFRQVGTSIVVRPTVLRNGMIRVRLAPHITYSTASESGVVEFAEATTELIVPNGTPVVLGGVSQELHTVTRRILGYRASQAVGETSMTLVATVL